MFIIWVMLAKILFSTAGLSESKNVYYTLEAHYFCGAPDGVEVCHILGVNGQFPGPLIEANQGDTLHISLTNAIQYRDGVHQNLTLHSHGILQNGFPFEDGPDSTTQCPIPWNHTQIYKFKLEQHGTYWYHSHVHAQYSEGMLGPLIVHNTPEVYAKEYDEEFTIIISDWYHTSGHTNTEWFLSRASGGDEPVPFSVLMNGRGSYPCNATTLPCDPEKQKPLIFTVRKGKRYRIRVINAAAITSFHFFIEKHNLTVIEVDGVDTVKVTFQKVPIVPAQRYSFIVHMNGDEDEYCINAKADLEMFDFGDNITNINPKPEALIQTVSAILRYEGHQKTGENSKKICEPDTGKEEEGFPGQELLRPYDGISAPANFDQQITYNVEPIEDEDGVNHLTFNNITFQLNQVPLLVLALQNKSLPEFSNPTTVEYQKVIQIVVNNHDDGSHPFHVHGHTFWVVGVGKTNDSDYDPSRDKLILDGVRRDTFQVQALSWAVIRFIADNPGVWLFHCHINWHLQSGLVATIVEAPKELRERIKLTSEAMRICAAQGVNIF